MNMVQRGVVFVLLLAFPSACGAAQGGPQPPSAVTGGANHCDRFENVEVHGREYVVQTNEWNSTLMQCVRVNDTAFAVTEANFGLTSAGPPASFPSIYKGCHWGNCTSESGLPVGVAKLPALPSSWQVQAPDAGAYDIAYDLWFNKTPTTSGQPDGTELMIWLSHRGGVQPAGSQIGTATLAGTTWDVWQVRMQSWTYIAYVRQTPIDSVDLDLRAFTQDAVGRGTIDASWYLIDIEAGFEIWQGGQGLVSKGFEARVGGT